VRRIDAGRCTFPAAPVTGLRYSPCIRGYGAAPAPRGAAVDRLPRPIRHRFLPMNRPRA